MRRRKYYEKQLTLRQRYGSLGFFGEKVGRNYDKVRTGHTSLPRQVAISQGQTVFIPQGLVVFGIFTIIGGITAFGRILMRLQIR